MRLLAVVVAALALAPTALGYSRHAELDEIASWLAMRPVEVQCLTEAETEADETIQWGASAYVEGYFTDDAVWHPHSSTVFAYGICEDLMALLEGRATDVEFSDLVWSLLVITHESGHLRGARWSGSEARTQCWAMRHLRYVAQRMGITDEVALRMVMHQGLEWHKGLPDNYLLKTCRLPRVT